MAKALCSDCRTPAGPVERRRTPQAQEIVAAFLERLPEVTDLMIAADSVIGGNVWLTASVPPGSRVTLSRDQLAYEITPASAGKPR